MLFKLKDIQPNPFRNVEKYPLRTDKLEDLKESIEATTYWDNIVARVGENGKPEIAFGHHRMEAMRQMYKPNHEIELIIRELSDATMIQMMARENNESYKTNALVIMESVRATVQALADGRISSDEMPVLEDTRKSILRESPYFSISCEPNPRQGGRYYTAQSLAKFLGMSKKKETEPQKKLLAALGALELIEQGLLTEATLRKEGDIGTERLFFLVKEIQDQHAAAKKEADRKMREAEAAQQRIEQQRAEYEARREADLKRARAASEAHEQRRLKEEAETRARKAKAEADQKARDLAQDIAKTKKDFSEVKQQIKEVGQVLAHDLKSGEVKANREAVQKAADIAAVRQGRTIPRTEHSADVLAKAAKLAEESEQDWAKASAKYSSSASATVSKKVIDFAEQLVAAGKKQLSIKYAQDKGGTKDDHQTVNAAATWLLELIKENR
jgi:hypothetical protein